LKTTIGLSLKTISLPKNQRAIKKPSATDMDIIPPQALVYLVSLLKVK